MTPAQTAALAALEADARAAQKLAEALAADAAAMRRALEDAPPVPTYTLTAEPSVVDEGGTVVFRLQTTGLAEASAVPYRLSDIAEADIATSPQGMLILGADGSAVLRVAVVADALTEGAEKITCTIGDSLATASATIRDTSTAPPPPPPAGRIEVRGPNVLRKARGEANNFDNGISDYIDVSDLPGPVPWEVYADDRQTLAPSRGGVEALHLWQRYHLFGHTQGLYQPMPRMVDGQLRQIYPNAGNFPEHAVLKLRVGPAGGGEHLVHGPRGVSVPSPYTTWHGHTRREGAVVHDSPAIPLYVGLTLHGHMVYAMRDGSMVEGGIVPVESWANDFAFYEAERKIFFYVDTGKGRLMRADRRTTPWTITTLADGFRQADSCRAIGETVYVTDSIAGEVWAVDARSGAKRLVCRLANAFWVDAFSDGTLAVAARTLAVHRVDPVSGSVGPNLTPSVYVNPPQAWVTVDVDRWGHMGAVDSFVVLGVTASVRGFHRISKTGATVEPAFGNFATAAGPLMWISEPWGHYPWTGAHHPDEALLMVQGMANLVPQLIVVKEPRPGWVGMRTPDSHAGWYDLGRNIALLGDTGPRLSTRYTTLLPQLAAGGGGLVTADHMAYWEHDRLRAFLLAGCLGLQPRDFNRDAVQGWGMRVLLNSQRYLIDGWPLVQRWVDYCRAMPA
ncbi:MAG: hypothetical protein EKK62_00095 [Acidimicrobiia bacterium]|nr:MAG: hypothetical protein EKK62_00095 [Acidimicrobiia bacterium]